MPSINSEVSIFRYELIYSFHCPGQADTFLFLGCTAHPGGTEKLTRFIYHLPLLDKLQPVGKMSWGWSEGGSPPQPCALDSRHSCRDEESRSFPWISWHSRDVETFLSPAQEKRLPLLSHSCLYSGERRGQTPKVHSKMVKDEITILKDQGKKNSNDLATAVVDKLEWVFSPQALRGIHLLQSIFF